MTATILIVEDEAIVARDLKGRLGKLGYTVVGITARGEQAIKLAEQMLPDLVLMDIHLQGDMDGIQAACLIREQFAIPVVFATANADDTTLRCALGSEPFGYILKPFEERELRTTIEMALYKSRSDRVLRDSEANKAAIMAAALEGIITTDLEGRIVEFNPAAEQMFGYSHAEALGQTVAELLLAPASREHFQLMVSQCPSSSGELVRGVRLEAAARRADGAEFPAEASLSRTERGHRPMMVSFWRDLSQSKLLEQQLRQAQKMQVVGQLAAGIAHDFNNLLTIINGHSEELFTSMRADFRACYRVQEIAKAGNKAAKLTRQLLAFSRQQILQTRTLDLNDLIADFQRMMGRLIGENITLTTRLAPNLGSVQVDSSQIEQVLMNLVVNARDAMPNGGHLAIETANAELDEAYAKIHSDVVPGRYAMVAVSDTGCGMDRTVQARLFEPFFTTKETGKGSGLGLATAYGIIKQSGGYICVYSEPGQGTTFKVYLPLVAVPGEPSTSSEAVEPAPSGDETVLLVEDEVGVRELLRTTLEGKGYAVLTARHGKEALHVAGKFGGHIDLLVTDVVMPEMGGRVLAERFAALYPQARVLFMSGYTDDIIIRNGVMQSDVEFLQKPCTMATLLHKVRAVLDREDSQSVKPIHVSPAGSTF